MPYWPLLLLVLTTTLCRSDPVDQLCCLGGPLGSSLGIPQIGLDGSGCPVDPYATSVAVAVDANDTYIQAFFPYCTPLLDKWSTEGRKIILPVAPKAGDLLWEGYKATVIESLDGAYTLVRTLGHGTLVTDWMSKSCLHTLMRSVCYTAFRENARYEYQNGALIVNLPKPIPRQVCEGFDEVSNVRPQGNLSRQLTPCFLLKPFKTSWQYVSNSPASTPVTCRQALSPFFTALVAQGRLSNSSFNSLLPSCSDCECGCRVAGSNPLVAYQPRFAANQQSWNLTTLNSALPTQVVVANTDVPASDAFSQSNRWPCFFPLEEGPTSNPLAYCGIRCPSPFRTASEYRRSSIMMGILGWSSYLSTALVMLTMVFMPRYRLFPANLVVFALFCSHVLAFGFVFPITRGYRKTVCHDQVNPRWGFNRENAACVFNAVTILFGGLGTSFFWSAIAINSFIVIYLKRDSVLRSKFFQIATLSICFGVPSLCCIIALATEQIGSPQQLQFCFVTDDPYHPTDQKGFMWQYPLFFGPIGFCIVSSIGAIVMVLWEMRGLRAASGASRYGKHLRIAAFLVVFLGVFAFVFAYRFTITKDGNEWRSALSAWISRSFEGHSLEGITTKPNHGLWLAFNFFIGIQGTLIALLFGSNPDVLQFWYDRLKNLQEGRSFFSAVTSYQGTSSKAVGTPSVRQSIQE